MAFAFATAAFCALMAIWAANEQKQWLFLVHAILCSVNLWMALT